VLQALLPCSFSQSLQGISLVHGYQSVSEKEREGGERERIERERGERERDRGRERERMRKKGERDVDYGCFILILTGMMGALAPFSHLVI